MRAKSKSKASVSAHSPARQPQAGVETDVTIDLVGINVVLSGVGSYPVTSAKLAKEARKRQVAPSVVRFFESIPGDTEFSDKADVIRRSVEAEMLMEEQQHEPEEKLRDYDE